MIKHVILDIDGTVLNEDHQLLDETKNYLIELQQRGINVHLASGRTARRMKDVYDALQINDYCISGNGYKIFHTQKHDETIIDSFSSDQIQYFFNLVKPFELETFSFDDTILNYYLPEKLYLEKVAYQKENNIDPSIPLIGGPYSVIFNHGDAYDEKNRVEALKDAAYKICVRGEYEDLLKIQNALQDEPCQCLITSTSWLEILPLGNSKGKAVKLLCEKCRYDINEVIAFGDGENDVTMLQVVKYGYAMGNALDSVKQAVEHVAPTNNEQGVLQVLKSIFN